MSTMSFQPLIPVLLTVEEAKTIRDILKYSRDYLSFTPRGEDIIFSILKEINSALREAN